MIRLHLIPESPADGPPWACAEIRLLRPYGHASLARHLTLTSGRGLPSGRVDAVVMQRGGPVGADLRDIVSLVAEIKARKARLIYDLDDDLLAEHPSLPVERVLSNMRPKVRFLLREADMVTVSTDVLAARLKARIPNVHVWKNALDEALVPEWPKERRGADIGYFGTNSHLQDLMEVVGELSIAASKQPQRPSLELCGISDDPRIGGLFGRSVDVSVRPTQGHYAQFHRMLAHQACWAVGLAPLLPGPFNDAKSDIKALDYAAAGIPVIVSDVTPYASLVAAGAVLCAPLDRFGEATFDLLNDEAGRARLTAAAHHHLMERRVLAVCAPDLFSLLGQALDS